MQVSFKMPSLYKGIDANIVYKEIQGIGENVTPEQIVDMAKDENTESHKCFEWNDAIAGHKYRVMQAGEVVRHLVIEEHPVTKAEPMKIRVMFPSKDGGYKPTKVIVEQKDEYEALLERAKAELRNFKQKYSIISSP